MRQAQDTADAGHFRPPRPGPPRSPRSPRSINPHSWRPGRPSAGGFVQRAFFAHRAVARRLGECLDVGGEPLGGRDRQGGGGGEGSHHPDSIPAAPPRVREEANAWATRSGSVRVGGEAR